jgi:hypothetical protein
MNSFASVFLWDLQNASLRYTKHNPKNRQKISHHKERKRRNTNEIMKENKKDKDSYFLS